MFLVCDTLTPCLQLVERGERAWWARSREIEIWKKEWFGWIAPLVRFKSLYSHCIYSPSGMILFLWCLVCQLRHCLFNLKSPLRGSRCLITNMRCTAIENAKSNGAKVSPRITVEYEGLLLGKFGHKIDVNWRRIGRLKCWWDWRNRLEQSYTWVSPNHRVHNNIGHFESLQTHILLWNSYFTILVFSHEWSRDSTNSTEFICCFKLCRLRREVGGGENGVGWSVVWRIDAPPTDFLLWGVFLSQKCRPGCPNNSF